MATPKLTDSAVDDDIASDWREIAARNVEAEIGEEPETPAETVTETEPDPTQAAEAAEKPVVARNRDEKTGQFKEGKPAAASKLVTAKTTAVAPAGQKQPTEAQEQPASDQQTTTEQRPARDTTRAPSTWKPTARAEWDKLPPTIREEIHRRETDFIHGQQQLLPDARLGQSMRQVIEPYRMMIESEGGNPAAAVSDLLRTANILRNGSHEVKLAAVGRIASQFGVDLSRLVPSGNTPDGQAAMSQSVNPAQFRDPRVDALLNQREQEQQQQRQAEEHARTQAAEQWMNEMDAQGNPLRPYVNDVMVEMQGLVPQIRQREPGLSHAQVLQKAYDQATWAHPEVRTLLLQRQQQEEQQRRATENQQRIAGAKRATSGNVPRRASTPAPAQPGRMEETIAATARELGLMH